MLGDVQDALSGVVERRAHVDALPLRQAVALGALGGEAEGGADTVEIAAELQCRRGQDDGAVREELLPQQSRDVHGRHPQRRAAVPVRGSGAGLVPLVPDHVPLGAVHDPLRHVVDGLHRGQGLFADRVLVLGGLVAGGADRGDDGAGGVPQRRQGVAEVLRDLLQPAGQRQFHQPLEALRGGLQLVGGLLVHQFGGAPDRPVDLAGGQFTGGHAGDPGDQLVRLVDDQDLVLRKHRGALDGVDREQRVVGDHDIGELGLLPGRLRKALGAVGALGRAQALPGGHRHLCPGAVRHARCEVVTVAGLGLVGPVAQAQQVLAQLAGGGGGLELVEEAVLLVLRHALAQPVQAQVVRSALEHRELRAAAQQRVQCLDGARKITLHELALQRQGGGRDHDALPVRERGHQVPERLSGAGACLDQQVGAVVDGGGDGFGHGHLAGALRTADGCDGGMQEFGE